MTAGTTVSVGRIVRPHALSGEVVVRQTALAAGEFSQLPALIMISADGRDLGRITVRSVRPFGSDLLVKFEGVDHIDRAQELRGVRLDVERSDLPRTAEDEIYLIDLIGLEVVEESGRSLGKVESIIPTSAHEVLEVTDGDQRLLLPYHSGVILGWDRDVGRLTVRLPDGLEEIYRSPRT